MQPHLNPPAAPYSPPRTLNDDDIYVVDVRHKKVLRAVPDNARALGFQVGVGQALLTGMQAKFLGVQ